MRDAIKDKLNSILQRAPSSESEVVYVFVEIRKFLERGGDALEKQFATLKFFCDWIAHVELTLGGAKNALARLDPEIGTTGPFDPTKVTPTSQFYRLMSLEPLLEEAKRFCSDYGFPTQWALNPLAWRECMRSYGRVIEDCPLAITRNKHAKRYIKRLTLQVAKEDVKNESGIESFSWDWFFELSDGQSFALRHQFRYVAPTHDPSHPILGELGI